MEASQGKHKKTYGTTGYSQPIDEITASVEDSPENDVFAQYDSEPRPCCDILLDIITTTVFLGYSVFLVWLLAHLKGNSYYYLLSLIPFFLIVLPPLIICSVPKKSDPTRKMVLWHFGLLGVVVTLMSTFTMLTRLAYYQLSHHQTIGRNFVVVSLKANILVFLWYLLACVRFSLTKIKAKKDIITRLILDNVDIFNMIELLDRQSDLGISETSTFENVVQAFCSVSFFLIIYESTTSLITEDTRALSIERKEMYHFQRLYVYSSSLLIQNFPFFIIRLVIWGKYDVYNLGFLAKNGMALVFGVAEIRSAWIKLV